VTPYVFFIDLKRPPYFLCGQSKSATRNWGVVNKDCGISLIRVSSDQATLTPCENLDSTLTTTQ